MKTTSITMYARRHFKHEAEEGRKLAAVVAQRTQHLADLRRGVRDASSAVNAAKAQIDELSTRLGQGASEAPAAGRGDVLDAERHRMLAELKAAKAK